MKQMAINCEKFRDKHREFLKNLPSPQKEPTNLVYYRAPGGKKRILFIEDVPPNANKGAGFPRANMVVNLMHELGYEVTIYTTFSAPESWAVVYSDIPIDVEVIFGRGFDGLNQFLLERIRYFDLIWIGRPHNMDFFVSACLKYRRNSQIPVIYDSEAIFCERLKHLLDVNIDKHITSAYVQTETEREYRLASHATAVVSVSEYEAGLWRNQFSGPIHILGHDCELVADPAPFSSREGIAFLGTLYGIWNSPNWDSIVWYIDEVMPRLKQKYNLTGKLIFVGNCMVPKKTIGRYAEHIHFVGSVDNLKETLDRYRILVVPTRFAAGIPQKVFDAAKYGIPTVCTTLIAKQMTWSDGKETLAADWRDPDGFAERCASLYQNEQLWSKVQGAAREWMARQPRRDALKNHLASILRSLGV